MSVMRTWTFPTIHPVLSGPWDDEPDKAQWVNEATGLDCLIVRGRSGALCGYVGVPDTHPWHGRDYSDVQLVEPPHGDLTFSAFCQEGAEDGPGICHVPEPGRPAKVWWFGFDCAHFGDVMPALLEYAVPAPPDCGQVYRTFEYVRKEIELLALQLSAITA